MARRCGYCREYNHDSSKCNKRLSTIEHVLNHYYNERKRIVEALIASGFGTGAMVQLYDYFAGQEMACIITDPNDCLERNSLHEYRNVKYSKQVNTTFRSITGYFPRFDDWSNIKTMTSNTVMITAVPVSGSQSTVTGYIHVADLDRSFLHNDHRPQKTSFSWERTGSLLVPSFDGHADVEALKKPVHIHERLDKKNKWVNARP